MTASARPSIYHYVVDEPLLHTIAAEIQAAIPVTFSKGVTPWPPFRRPG